MIRRAVPRAAAVSTLGLLATSLILPVASHARTTLSVAMWLNDAATAKFAQGVIADYAAKNGLNIKVTYTPWDGFLDKLLAMTAGGQSPDVFVVERRWLPRFASTSIVQPLDAMAASDKFDPKRQLSDVRSGFYDGRFYGFPIWYGPALQYYNPAMFTSAGVPEPNQLIASDRWDWDNFVAVGRKLTRDTNGDGVPDVYALDAISTWNPDWVSKIRQAGGDIFDATYKTVLVNQPAAVEGLQYFCDLANRYNIAPKGGAGVAFGSKKSAMSAGWLSQVLTYKDTYRKAGVDMQLTVYPRGKAGYVTVAGGNPVCVSASTKNPKAAYRFAKWFAMDSDEWKSKGAPASRATYEGAYTDYLAGSFSNPGATIRLAMENASAEPCIHPKHQLIEAAEVAAVAAAITGKVSPVQAAQRMADELTRVLSRR